MTHWQQLGRTKFPFGPISGSGPFALVRKCPNPLASHSRWRISLYLTFERAEAAGRKDCADRPCNHADHFIVCLDARELKGTPVNSDRRVLTAPNWIPKRLDRFGYRD